MTTPIVFLHLSDIHFNKNSSDHYDLDHDLRDQLQRDLAKVKKEHFDSVTGVLVSGDIAYSGNKLEYDIARDWLKAVCLQIGSREHDVWCIPGNHDVDRSAYDSSALLKSLHSSTGLRPENPNDVDARIAEFLRDSEARQILFRPLEQYNDFASKFSCGAKAEPLCWHSDFKLSDGSILRVRGVNSTLVSDKTDNNSDRRLIVGEKQALAPEIDGVAYLAMCHHPPDWLIDQDHAHECFKSRVAIQLFGHKHVQNIETINQCLRIGAGAVHPSRAEQKWKPRYNWLRISVRTEANGDRFLTVDVYPRVWSEDLFCFVPDTPQCDEKQEFKRVSLAIPKWTPTEPISCAVPKTETTIGAETSGTQPEAQVTSDTSTQSMTQPDDSEYARILTYRFLDLPHVVRIDIARSLALLSNEDEGLLDFDLLDRIFERAVRQRLLERLWERVEREHGGDLGVTNPYVGR